MLFIEIDPNTMLNVDSIAFMFRVPPEEHEDLDFKDEPMTVIQTTGGQLHTSKTPQEVNNLIIKVINSMNKPRLSLPTIKV